MNVFDIQLVIGSFIHLPFENHCIWLAVSHEKFYSFTISEADRGVVLRIFCKIHRKTTVPEPLF